MKHSFSVRTFYALPLTFCKEKAGTIQQLMNFFGNPLCSPLINAYNILSNLAEKVMMYHIPDYTPIGSYTFIKESNFHNHTNAVVVGNRLKSAFKNLEGKPFADFKDHFEEAASDVSENCVS